MKITAQQVDSSDGLTPAADLRRWAAPSATTNCIKENIEFLTNTRKLKKMNQDSVHMATVLGDALAKNASIMTDHQSFLVFKKIMDNNSIESFMNAGQWFEYGVQNPMAFMSVQLPGVSNSNPDIIDNAHNLRVYKWAIVLLMYSYIRIVLPEKSAVIVCVRLVCGSFGDSLSKEIIDFYENERHLLHPRPEEWRSINPMQKLTPYIMAKFQYNTSQTDHKDIIAGGMNPAFDKIGLSIFTSVRKLLPRLFDQINFEISANRY